MVALVILGVIVVVWSFQRRLVYLPGGPPPPVEQVFHGAVEVTLTTSDGLDLQAWWVEAGPTAVLVLPGNAGNRAGRVPLAAALEKRGLSVLLLDYRGYGGNPGTPSQAGLLTDARAAADWLRARPNVGGQVAGEPHGGELGDVFERAGFLEQVGGAGHERELVGAAQQPLGLFVEPDDDVVAGADDQQRRGADLGQAGRGQVGAPTA
jgi:fermentation-respiration switch protein FrsA (DUF1100 family)